jgi:hypothetical protein
MRLGQMQDQRPRPGDEAHVKPHTIGKDPPRCRMLYGGALLVRTGGAVVLAGMANAVRQRRIDQQADRHHHQERHAPLGLFARQRRGQKAWICEEAKAAFRMPWACVAREQLLGRERSIVKCVGGHQETTLLIDRVPDEPHPVQPARLR